MFAIENLRRKESDADYSRRWRFLGYDEEENWLATMWLIQQVKQCSLSAIRRRKEISITTTDDLLMRWQPETLKHGMGFQGRAGACREIDNEGTQLSSAVTRLPQAHCHDIPLNVYFLVTRSPDDMKLHMPAE